MVNAGSSPEVLAAVDKLPITFWGATFAAIESERQNGYGVSSTGMNTRDKSGWLIR